ncbi:DUF5317 domain-containing protein [Frankia sp. AgPm24]|uniref:DUF5317 domain-containing protein n=1 Tax=Frankia sp. AgPm24 TaxID=631128 RepID=UPI00200CD89F|nr:DUF5317 domain-containing protein [Frankia sp. AgPm24]MCK9924080.1 DUF5317 domain-containing protein [Frankia sp. AgPm24]
MLVLVVLTLVIGLGVGLARGGTLSALARVHVQQPLLFAALILAVAVGGLVPALHSVAWIVAAVLAALFAGMNNRLPGLGLLVAGIIANAAVITANGGQMPVSLWQAQHAGVPANDILRSAFHTPADGDTSLRLLSDIIPFALPGVPAVLSIGDVLIAAALGVFGAVTPVRAWRTLQARRNAALAGALPAAYGGPPRPGTRRSASGVPAYDDLADPQLADPQLADMDPTTDDSWEYVRITNQRRTSTDGSDEPDELDAREELDGQDDPGDLGDLGGQGGQGEPQDLGGRAHRGVPPGPAEPADDPAFDDRGGGPLDGWLDDDAHADHAASEGADADLIAPDRTDLDPPDLDPTDLDRTSLDPTGPDGPDARDADTRVTGPGGTGPRRAGSGGTGPRGTGSGGTGPRGTASGGAGLGGDGMGGDGYDPYDISVFRASEERTSGGRGAKGGGSEAGGHRLRPSDAGVSETDPSGLDDPWGDGPTPRQPGATARG